MVDASGVEELNRESIPSQIAVHLGHLEGRHDARPAHLLDCNVGACPSDERHDENRGNARGHEDDDRDDGKRCRAVLIPPQVQHRLARVRDDLALPPTAGLTIRHAEGGRRRAPGVEETRRPWLNDTSPWRPMATYVLLGSIAGIYLLQLLTLEWTRTDAFGLGQEFLWHGLPHYWPDFLFVINTDWMWRPWTLVTSTLAHSFADVNHLLFNGMFLFFFGPSVERLLGVKRYVALFLAAGALAGVTQVHAVAYAESGDPLAYLSRGGALGASGALMALFGILMILTPNQKVSLFFVLPVPLWAAGIGYAALDLLGVFTPRSILGGNIGHFAHLSGMALGLAYGLWVKLDWKKRGLRLVYE